MKDFFRNRRSVRKYTDRQVERHLLDDMLEQACKAPTLGGLQLYSVVVTISEEGKSRLAPAHFNQPAVTGASVVLTFCADWNRVVKWCEESGAEPGYDNFQSFVGAFLDATAVAQQFCTIAELNGLGTCYMGTTTWNAPMIAEALRLPRLVVPVATVTLGYPAEDGVWTDRLPLAAIVHNEVYEDYSSERIRRTYEYKESLPENHGFVAENNCKSLAQVFTDVRYPRAANEEFSAVFYDFIEKAGFHWPQK